MMVRGVLSSWPASVINRFCFSQLSEKGLPIRPESRTSSKNTSSEPAADTRMQLVSRAPKLSRLRPQSRNSSMTSSSLSHRRYR